MVPEEKWTIEQAVDFTYRRRKESSVSYDTIAQELRQKGVLGENGRPFSAATLAHVLLDAHPAMRVKQSHGKPSSPKYSPLEKEAADMRNRIDAVRNILKSNLPEKYVIAELILDKA